MPHEPPEALALAFPGWVISREEFREPDEDVLPSRVVPPPRMGHQWVARHGPWELIVVPPNGSGWSVWLYYFPNTGVVAMPRQSGLLIRDGHRLGVLAEVVEWAHKHLRHSFVPVGPPTGAKVDRVTEALVARPALLEGVLRNVLMKTLGPWFEQRYQIDVHDEQVNHHQWKRSPYCGFYDFDVAAEAGRWWVRYQRNKDDEEIYEGGEGLKTTLEKAQEEADAVLRAQGFYLL